MTKVRNDENRSAWRRCDDSAARRKFAENTKATRGITTMSAVSISIRPRVLWCSVDEKTEM